MAKVTFSKNNDILVDGKRTDMYVREGSYRGTTDDRLGRWYTGDRKDNFFRPFGAGHATRMRAAEAAVDHSFDHGRAHSPEAVRNGALR